MNKKNIIIFTFFIIPSIQSMDNPNSAVSKYKDAKNSSKKSTFLMTGLLSLEHPAQTSVDTREDIFSPRGNFNEREPLGIPKSSKQQSGDSLDGLCDGYMPPVQPVISFKKNPIFQYNNKDSKS